MAVQVTRPRRLLRIGAALLPLALVAGASPYLLKTWNGWGDRKEELGKLPRAVVRRADFNVVTNAGGQVQSSLQTKIECQVEAINYRARGVTFSGSGSSTILTLVPDGSMVKKGDILCTLDGSEFEEIVRTQTIRVEEEKAEVLEAELNLEVAELAVKEFLDGTFRRQVQEMDGKIKLAESDVERWADRLKWSEKMAVKGYVSLAQIATEQMSYTRSKQQLMIDRMARENYTKYTKARTLHTLNGAVEQARMQLRNERAGFERDQERLAYYKRMVEYCTIRAPHDGFVIYASNMQGGGRRGDDRDRIEVGYQVRQRQDLFYLPDLSKMEVIALLNESVVEQVRAGMPTKVEVEGIPGRIMEGHVETVTRLPLVDERNQDVKNYVARVKIDTVPEGLRPGMTAEVQILTGRRQNVLTIPPAALTIEEGQEVCYVARADGLERREVTVGAGDLQQIEVTGGLEEGEEVVLDPTRFEELPTLVLSGPEPGPADEREPSVVALH